MVIVCKLLMKQNRLAVFLSIQFTSKMNGNCTVSLGKGSIYKHTKQYVNARAAI